MFGNNGHEPILSQMEIRFLLSDQPISIKRAPRSTRNEKKGTTKNPEKKATIKDHFAQSGEPR